MTFHLSAPHRRLNALTGEWVCVSPQRNLRPWQGRTESVTPAKAGAQHYDPHCYLCPGNTRANGERNPNYASTYAFTNDFPALVPAQAGSQPIDFANGPLVKAQSISGICRVLCFSPRHDLTLAQMTTAQIRQVVDLWAEQVTDLGRRHRWVQIFENKGELMGCSNPHPHGQVWASDFLPTEPANELAQQRVWFDTHGTSLLLDYAAFEGDSGERTVLQTRYWLTVVPWWAAWPFETLILPRRKVLRIPDLTASERDDLADHLRRLLSGYDRVFDTSFPYSMGWHGAPTDDVTPANASAQSYQYWQLHAHIYPPLLRSATVKKFMVGYEMLAEPQRDLTPETAADMLRRANA